MLRASKKADWKLTSISLLSATHFHSIPVSVTLRESGTNGLTGTDWKRVAIVLGIPFCCPLSGEPSAFGSSQRGLPLGEVAETTPSSARSARCRFRINE